MKVKSYAVTEINGVRIGKHGVRIGGKYFPAWYSHGKMTDGQTAITIYAKTHCPGLPEALGAVENNSDHRSDYFEKDRVRFNAGTAEFQTLLPFCKHTV